jgi:fumarate hydratase subunit alpha
MDNAVVKKTKDTLIKAASSCTDDHIEAYKRVIAEETNERAAWAMQTILDNAYAAKENRGPLCDDTGIPHVILEMGPGSSLTKEMIESIDEGVREGLRELPGRPMGVMGDDVSRLDQSGGLSTDPAFLAHAPLLMLDSDEPGIRLNILMQGGGPEIRSKTFRVFHKHDIVNIKNEIVTWASDEVGNLGCTPCSLAVGIGRTHYEASSMMLSAMIKSDFSRQSDIENEITERVNKTNVGPLGLGGRTVLATFLRVGPQRASGVRIVCLRPGCCFEPRKASVIL